MQAGLVSGSTTADTDIEANAMLRFMFVLGALVDGGIAMSWFLIAAGWKIPNVLNGYMGAGQDYQLAMYVAAMFVSAWTVLLAWGALKPIERRALLLITSAFLFMSVVLEFMFFGDMLGGAVFVFGVTKRLVLAVLFASAYFVSINREDRGR